MRSLLSRNKANGVFPVRLRIEGSMRRCGFYSYVYHIGPRPAVFNPEVKAPLEYPEFSTII
jgi:hypothetical protein